MFAIFEINGIRKTATGGGFLTFTDAVEHAHATLSVAFYEEDADYPGEAGDLLTNGGTVYAIERLK